MPISVRDIQEKEFSRQKRDGYNIEEVDDFLDEISDQLSVLIRENMALAEQVKTLQAENEKLAANASAPAAEPAPVPVSAPAPVETVSSDEPAYDEPSYFKNLELTLRDTLVNAQRIADETVADARKKAQEVISSAEEQAAHHGFQRQGGSGEHQGRGGQHPQDHRHLSRQLPPPGGRAGAGAQGDRFAV